MNSSKALEVMQTDDFKLEWNDKGSGGRMDGSFWRPIPPKGFYSIGDYAQGNYGSPAGTALVVKPIEENAIAHPTDYEKIWTDRGSGAHKDGSFWRPLPPKGYVALGVVANLGHGKPDVNVMVCIREDLVVDGHVGSLIWNDAKTGAKHDFSAWSILPNSSEGLTGGNFIGVATHNKPSASPVFHCLDSRKVMFPSAPSLSELSELANKYAPIVYFEKEEHYYMCSIEYFLENAQLLDKNTKKTSTVTPENIPTGAANKDKYQLILSNKACRAGSLADAKTYVHAMPSSAYTTDLQYWFLYTYNGPGTARIKWLVADTTVHSGNPSLTPLGEHEGDWEHVTIRISNLTRQVEKIYFSQHGDGAWVDADDIEFQGKQPIVYSSKNGHASYPHVGSNYTEHRKYGAGFLTALEFFLRNDTNKGRMKNFATCTEVVSADYLGSDKPEEPRWLNYLGRWGASTTVHLSEKTVEDVIKAAFGPIIGGVINHLSLVGKLAKILLSHYVTEDQDGPTAPKAKGEWSKAESEEQQKLAA